MHNNYRAFNPHSIRQNLHKPYSENKEDIIWYDENDNFDIVEEKNEKEDNER